MWIINNATSKYLPLNLIVTIITYLRYIGLKFDLYLET